MIGFKKQLLALTLIAFSGVAAAQTSTNSPYTRYGYGNLADQGSSNSKAMGGVAYGLRDKYQINAANPASYTAVDSLTFIFDGSLSLQKVNFSNGTVKQNANNASFDYITMQFRATPWAAISAGILPYSNVGYNISRSNSEQENFEGNLSALQYTGEGGLHQLYLGAGFKILKNLSVGANISYLWGDVTRVSYVTFPGNSSLMPFTNSMVTSIKNYKLDFGVQYTHEFDKKHQVTVGVVFSPGHNLNPEFAVTHQTGNSTTGYTVVAKDTVGACDIPTTLGLGATYVYDNRLTVGADVTWQNWSNSSYVGDSFCDRYKLSVGAEYIPNPMGRNYLSHIKYRVGGFYHKPYYKIGGERAATEYGVTAGFGLPVPRTRSVISVALMYGHTKGANVGILNENAFRLTVGMTFNERWFFKRKVQ